MKEISREAIEKELEKLVEEGFLIKVDGGKESEMNDSIFATLDDTILYIWKNAKDLTLNDINRMIQQLKTMLESEK